MSNENNNDDHVDEDYEFARKHYYNVLEKGEEALDEALDFLKDAEHPRMYEVFAGLMKANSDVADRLMELQKKKREVYNTDQAQLPGSTNNTQNNIYVGSTTDLQRMIHDKKKNGSQTIDQDNDDSDDEDNDDED